MNRLITAYVVDTSACPKRQAVFLLHIFRKMESRIMKKSFKDHGYEDLFLPSEIKQDRNRKNESE